VRLVDLVDINKWQEIQDIFSYVTGIGLRTLDAKGAPVTAYSGEPTLCRKLIRNNRNRYNICQTCAPTFLGGDAIVDRNLSFVCPPGLHNFTIPLRLPGAENLGYMIFGPVILVSRKPKEYYFKIADELNVDHGALWDAMLEIRVLSFNRLQAVLDLLKDICGYVLKIAYEKRSAEQEIQQLSSQEGEDALRNLFEKFLNMALQVSGADIGSIMILNSEKELTIRVAKGLSEDVVKNTHIRVGEGISGRAVSENTPFLINENYADSRIKPFLNRPQIKSSMILPIKIHERPLGVMNLGALQNSPVKFNSDNVMSMSSLIELAGLAFDTPKN